MRRIGYALWYCAIGAWMVFMVLASVGCSRGLNRRFARNTKVIERAIPAGPLRMAWVATLGHCS